jgi:hypothetical protein
MGILDGIFGGGQGGGLLGGFGEKLRDAAPIMSAIGNNQDIGMAQFRVQQMQARRQAQQEEELQKKMAAALAQKMGLPPELASSPESVFSLARSMKLAEEERKNRRPERVSFEEQWLRNQTPEVQNELMRSKFDRSSSVNKPADVLRYEYAMEQRKAMGQPTVPIEQWSQAEAAKAEQGKPLPAEVAGRVGMMEPYLNEADAIGKRIDSGEITGPIDTTLAQQGVGDKGRLYAQIESGVDALVRNLTGAGMTRDEAAAYARRYLPTYADDAKSMRTKHDQLVKELQSIRLKQYEGRRTGVSPVPTGPQGPQAPKRLRYNPQTGTLE